MRPSPPTAVPGLRRVINAWGPATPFGVSCSDVQVAQAVALMLRRHVVMADLQAAAARRIAQWSGAPAGCVTHCTAAAITLAVAACMAGSDAARIAQLPDASGMPARVLLLAAHQVNYGHAITQAVRLAGAQAVACADTGQMRAALTGPGVACVLAVESHLAEGSGTAATRELVGVAHAAGVPLVIDGAAQDWRAAQMIATGADLVLVSAQKYLGGPTAGLVMGRADLVAAVDAQHAGIGRAMKPSKEALAGVIAALDLREAASAQAWQAAQAAKVDAVAQAASRWPGVQVTREADPQGNGMDRLWLSVSDAPGLLQRLREADPVVAVAPHRAARGQVGLELTGVRQAEVGELCRLLEAAIRAGA